MNNMLEMEIAYRLFLKFNEKNIDGDILFLTQTNYEAVEIHKFLKFFFSKNNYFLPGVDGDLYEKVSPDPAFSLVRSKVLGSIAFGESRKILITSADNLFKKLTPKDFFIENIIFLDVNDAKSPQKLSEKLVQNGFYRVSTVNTSGEFAQRGDIVDIAISEEEAYRLYFDWDKITQIKTLDISTQRSLDAINNLRIFPLSELVLNKQTIDYFSENYKKNLGFEADIFHYENILKGRKINGIENLLPLFFEKTESILDFLQKPTIVINFNLAKYFENFYEKSKIAFEHDSLNSDLILEPSQRLISRKQIDEISSNALTLEHQGSVDVENLYFKSKHNVLDSIKLLCGFLLDKVKSIKIILSFKNVKNAEDLKPFLDEYGLKYQTISLYQEAEKNIVNIYLGELNSLRFEDVIIIEDSYIWGSENSRITTKSKAHKLTNFLLELNNFQAGEIVVHQDYGIAKFLGIEAVKVEDIVHDYVKLLYANDDKVYIPVENIEVIKKFGEGEPQLDRLGMATWQRRKALLKNKISEIAHKLINTAAHRLVCNNTPISTNQENYQKFCKLFPYVETHDQSNAISDIYNDLTTGKLMDRLICGDVGYGKTEVAMRAAFMILDDDKTKQVVVISPTTVLSRQHFISFKERFASFGIKIAQLSRFVAPKDQKQIKEQIKLGEVDIIIGTHGLFSDSISFKNLGLIIIDEEHQFGVKQKEKLKNIKKDCHVLSLSATPIPRTLQMSLVGIKDLSIIATPPFERLPVKAFIIEEDPEIIRDAINRELSRNGKIFYVIPRVEDLEGIYQKLKKLDSNLNIRVAHGQMPADELDKVLEGFYDGNFDILLSTNIVQSGLDVPDANTIIIHDAHLFGLSQLHQLKGRVGRKKTQGYCYFISKLDKVGSLSYRRLQIIQSASDLGAGFNISSHDIDIRGYGNLLGDEQSGHVKEVGVELYQEMLKAEISKIKNDKIQSDKTQNADLQVVEEDFTPVLSLGIPIYISDDYINDEALKLLTYRRIAQMASEQEFKELIAELTDRFGPIPIEVENLFNTVKLKSICKRMKISELDLGPKGIVLKFYGQAHLDKIIEFVNKYQKYSKIRTDGSIVLFKPIEEKEKIVQITKILKTLEEFIYG
jgi:transcription-repair coupling factor (superfamily II helicase)